MENQSYPVAKHSLIYGVYISVALIILTLIFYVLNLHLETWPGYIGYVVLLAGIVLASINYRDKRLGGYASYGQSFSSGFLAGLFAAIIVAVFTFFYMTMLGDNYAAEILQKAEENMLKQNPDMSDEQIDMALKWTENMTKPAWMAVWALLGNIFLSLIFSLIASIFIKKQEPGLTAE